MYVGLSILGRLLLHRGDVGKLINSGQRGYSRIDGVAPDGTMGSFVHLPKILANPVAQLREPREALLSISEPYANVWVVTNVCHPSINI